MIIPIINMDATPLVQFLVFISYIGLVYMLSVELIGYHPFYITKKTVQAEIVLVERNENPPVEDESEQAKVNSDEGKFVEHKCNNIMLLFLSNP